MSKSGVLLPKCQNKWHLNCQKLQCNSSENMFEINYSQLIQYEILEKLVTFIMPKMALKFYEMDPKAQSYQQKILRILTKFSDF